MRFTLGLLAAIALAGQAHAITAFSIGAVGGVDPGQAPGEILAVTFDSANLPGVSESDGGAPGSVGVFASSVVDLAAAPAGDATRFEAIQPRGLATFDFSGYSGDIGSFSVYVGSIDGYDSFNISTTSASYSYNGNDFLWHDGNQSSHLTNRRIYFHLSPTESLRTIAFSSTGIAFEYDSIAIGPRSRAYPSFVAAALDLVGEDLTPLFPTSIPEPSSWAMMLIGVAITGGALRRRNSLTA